MRKKLEILAKYESAKQRRVDEPPQYVTLMRKMPIFTLAYHITKLHVRKRIKRFFEIKRCELRSNFIGFELIFSYWISKQDRTFCLAFFK